MILLFDDDSLSDVSDSDVLDDLVLLIMIVFRRGVLEVDDKVAFESSDNLLRV